VNCGSCEASFEARLDWERRVFREQVCPNGHVNVQLGDDPELEGPPVEDSEWWEPVQKVVEWSWPCPLLQIERLGFDDMIAWWDCPDGHEVKRILRKCYSDNSLISLYGDFCPAAVKAADLSRLERYLYVGKMFGRRKKDLRPLAIKFFGESKNTHSPSLCDELTTWVATPKGWRSTIDSLFGRALRRYHKNQDDVELLLASRDIATIDLSVCAGEARYVLDEDAADAIRARYDDERPVMNYFLKQAQSKISDQRFTIGVGAIIILVLSWNVPAIRAWLISLIS